MMVDLDPKHVDQLDDPVVREAILKKVEKKVDKLSKIDKAKVELMYESLNRSNAGSSARRKNKD